MPPPRRRAVAGLALAGLILAGLVYSPAAAAGWFREVVTSPWFPVALAALYLLRPLLAWPITAISVLVGYRYGVAVGLPVALAGAVATSLLPYAVARRFRPGDGLLGRAQAGSRRFFERAGDLRGVVAARLAPTPAEPVSAAAGAAGVSLPAFALGTAAGELPWTLLAVTAGASMGRLVATPAFDLRLAVAGVAVAALLLAGPAYRWWREWGAGSVSGSDGDESGQRKGSEQS